MSNITKKCSIDNCENKYRSLGLCEKHYTRMRRYGNPDTSFKVRHGKSGIPEYHIWVSMNQRCYNVNSQVYEHYGKRGIEVCEGWQSSFEKFFRDMGERPSDKHTIDRINNDGDYEPNNCRWALQVQQINNQQRVIDARGYTFDKRTGKWIARIGYNGKTEYIGSYETKEEAQKAYRKVKKRVLQCQHGN